MKKEEEKKRRKNTCQRQHWTHDTWCMTCDTWNVTYDMLQVTYDWWWEVNIIKTFQVPSSYGCGVKVFWRYFVKSVTLLIYQWISDIGVCRTAPAKPGLLNRLKHNLESPLYWWHLVFMSYKHFVIRKLSSCWSWTSGRQWVANSEWGKKYKYKLYLHAGLQQYI